MRKKEEEHDTYITSNLHLAATLKCCGFRIFDINVDKVRYPHRGEFIFMDSPEIQSAIGKYFDRSLSVEPQGLFDCLREIKSQVNT